MPSPTVTGALERIERSPAWALVGLFLVGAGVLAAWMLSDHSEGAFPLLLLLVAYFVAAYRPGREVVVAAVGMGALLVLIYLRDVRGFRLGQLVATAAAFGFVMLIGWLAQSRRQRIAALEDHQAEAALRAVADERLRIAREVHDVVAHSLGVIAVQASVGMQVIDADPDAARQALADISGASRSSLAEIRRLLGVVRSTDPAAYAPAPGLADLDRLVDEVAGTGLVIDIAIDGDPDVVPSGVGLAAYRIVQEALSNTLRHARARRATVHLACTPDALVIEVGDDGRGPGGRRSGGFGLVGMRERVAVYGGTLDVGPASGGGFRVAARLPYTGATS